MGTVEIRNDELGVTAFVAPSRTKHLGKGWHVVESPAPAQIRPGIEVENPPTVDEPQGVVEPASTNTPEEK